jgi:hypothetical protein
MRLALVAGFVAVLCSAASAEESRHRMEWEASPEAYFMTREERREWELVRTDDEAAARFIDVFRARRGSDFAAEVRRRVGLVDQRLALGEVKASSTLRGKIVILLGAPSETLVRPIPTATVGNISHAVATRKGSPAGDSAPQPSMIGNGAGWVEYTFRYAENAALGIGPDGWTVITEANGASGKDRLKYGRHKKALDDILEAAAVRSIRDGSQHPRAH